MARKKMWVRHDKALAELGYMPGSSTEALRRAVEWFRAQWLRLSLRTILVVAAESFELKHIRAQGRAKWILAANGPGPTLAGRGGWKGDGPAWTR